MVIAYLGQFILLIIFGAFDIVFVVAFSYLARQLAPVEFITCTHVGNESAAAQANHASQFTAALYGIGPSESLSSEMITSWVRSSGTQCMELRGTWAMFIIIALLSGLSLLAEWMLAYRKWKTGRSGKGGGSRSRNLM